MGCEFPIYAYRSEERSPSGKRLLTFNPIKSVNSTSPFQIPCNRCMGCKLERSRQWAVRMMHEAKMHDQNCYLTLTYDDEHVPANYSLDVRHLQLFMKRLRKANDQAIRFFACGEYGEKGLRPHYHAIIFNLDFDDRRPFERNANDDMLYTSEKLSGIWQQGHCTVGDVTFQSAGYVARYCTKKLTGEHADKYFRHSPIDGQQYNVRPEFSVMSRRPGIGATWLEKFKGDVFPSGYLVVNGVPQAPPKYYVSKLSEEEQRKLKIQSRARSVKHKPDNNNRRRYAKRVINAARAKLLKRRLET